ncbi:MAG: hypothetical protein K2N38_11350 [Oscillospiraceae bacterium]|nr:hypothetical protein [Oscillospiraceae bacterium]
MRRLFVILMILGLLRGCSYEPVGGIFDIPVVEPEHSTSYTIDLSMTRSPQVLSVTVENADDPYISNMLDVHMLHTGVVGLFGCPVEVEGVTENSRLIFRYDPENMKQVPARNLIGLYYNEENSYEELEPTLNEANHTVTFDIDGDGAYMLVDLYEWYRAWGVDLPEYAHQIDLKYEGGKYPSYYPSFYAHLPTGLTLSFSSDLERKIDGTGLIAKDFFRSTDNSVISVNAVTVRGENAWNHALESAENLKVGDGIADVLIPGSFNEIFRSSDRIVLLMESAADDEASCIAVIYDYVSDKEYVCVEASVSRANEDEYKGEMLHFVQVISFWKSGDPWYDHV